MIIDPKTRKRTSKSLGELPCGAYGRYQEIYYQKEKETGVSQMSAFKDLCDNHNYGEKTSIED